MTREEIEKKMDEPARKYVETPTRKQGRAVPSIAVASYVHLGISHAGAFGVPRQNSLS
jgi:hypothetical protein